MMDRDLSGYCSMHTNDILGTEFHLENIWTGGRKIYIYITINLREMGCGGLAGIQLFQNCLQ